MPTAVILRPFASKIHVCVCVRALEVGFAPQSGVGGSPPPITNSEASRLSARGVIRPCPPAVSHHLPLFLLCSSLSAPGKRSPGQGIDAWPEVRI